jgi:hypothetical protein
MQHKLPLAICVAFSKNEKQKASYSNTNQINNHQQYVTNTNKVY